MPSKYVGILKKGHCLGLSPMVGVTSIPFRLLCASHGADITCTEMISAQAIVRGNAKSLSMARVLREEKACGIQIMGPDAKTLANAIIKLDEMAASSLTNPSFYELNFACPSKNVTDGSRSGAYLLKNPKKIREIVNQCASATSLPISAKIRLGYGASNVLDVARACEDGGASAITIHARTAKQRYSGSADWKSIRQAKEKLGIYVIGNGDIVNAAGAKSAFDTSGCDGVMIGRGAMKNPLIFEGCKSVFSGGAEPIKTPKLISLLFEKYVRFGKKHKCLDPNYARYFASELTRGFSSGARTRENLSNCRSIKELQLALLKLRT